MFLSHAIRYFFFSFAFVGVDSVCGGGFADQYRLGWGWLITMICNIFI